MLTQYGKKGFGEEENVSGNREQKKLQSTGNSGWLVCVAVLGCSHLLLIVVIGIEHAMLATQCKAPTMPCIHPVERFNCNVEVGSRAEGYLSTVCGVHHILSTSGCCDSQSLTPLGMEL